MNIKQHIPNTITLCNLLCGVIATIFAYNELYLLTAIFFLSGVIFDFFDGFAARLLHVKSEMGKELDSLADVITSGLAPAMVMFSMMRGVLSANGCISNEVACSHFPVSWVDVLSGTAFLIVMFSALRLAKFNIDTRQTDSFIGMPTPANGLIIVFLPFLLTVPVIGTLLGNFYVLLGITVVCSLLLVAELPLFALKFKNFGWKKNEHRWILIILSVVLISLFQFKAFPFIIVTYLLMSWYLLKKKS